MSLYVASKEFLIYYLEVGPAISSVISMYSIDDIDLEARSHRGLRPLAGEHATIDPSTGNCFFHVVTVPLGRRID